MDHHHLPDPTELVELMERQDDMVELLQNELEVCKKELRNLADYSRKLEGDLADSDKTVKTANRRMEQINDDYNEIKKENEDLKKELQMYRKSGIFENESMGSMAHLRHKIRELEFELERERRALVTSQMDLDAEKMNAVELKNEMTNSLKMRQTTDTKTSARVESTMKQMAEWKAKFEVLSAKHEEEITRLESKLEVAAQREAYMEDYSRKIQEDSSTIRKEKLVLASRVAAMIEENSSLRSKMLKMSTGPSIQSMEESNGFSHESQLQKLLSDQSHLIAALREEAKLLASKLEQQTGENRLTIKRLKKEKKELEDRLHSLLSI